MVRKPIFLFGLSTVFACTGEIGEKGVIGADGLSVLIDTKAEAAGDNCENGGFLISSGVDSNQDGVLDEAEISDMEYICNGVDETADPENMLVTESEYLGEANAECLGGFVLVEFGYDLDMSGSLEGAEVETSLVNCNVMPEISVDAITLIDDCTVDTVIPVLFTDVNGTVDAVSISIVGSGSTFTPTIDLSGNLTIPAGTHQSGAVLALTATDNYGAESIENITVGFTGTGCLPTENFYGVQTDTCESIEVDAMAGDDRGGVTLTAQYAYYNGDDGLVRTDLDLGNLTLVQTKDVDTLIGDPVTGTLYTFWSSSFTYTNLQEVDNDDLEDNADDIVSWDQLAIIDEDTFDVLSTITLESPLYVPNYSNPYDFDFGEGVESDVQTYDIMVGMRGDSLLIAEQKYGSDSNNYAIEMTLVDVVTGLNVSSSTVYNLEDSSADDVVYDNLVWSEQEVDIQHYLLMERGGEHFITYRQNETYEMIEVNVATGSYTTVSTTFGTSTDMSNLALDASGLYAYFHTEDGFSKPHEESMERCMVLFSENDGSVNDRGNDY